MDSSHIFHEEEEGLDVFFDSREEISSECSSSTCSTESGDFRSVETSVGSTTDPRFRVWMGKPGSVRDLAIAS